MLRPEKVDNNEYRNKKMLQMLNVLDQNLQTRESISVDTPIITVATGSHITNNVDHSKDFARDSLRLFPFCMR